tara:strand:- start:197 stop:1300 length:1104 start_codon:yes stop_codon:yes gene_type:complete
MSNPIKQHYIPRSYLKNFGVEGKKGKYFVDVYRLEHNHLLEQIDIRDICFQKNLYTLPVDSEDKKYALEKYYAEHVDSEYPKVYKLLVDETLQYVDAKQKLQILYVCLSLYFRTPKMLDMSISMNEQIFNRAAQFPNKEGLVKITIGERKSEFHIDDLDKVKNEFNEKSRHNFLIQHLEYWADFVKYKFDCTINVIKINNSKTPLITSDTPVSIRHINTNKFEGLYDPNAVITLPLDRSHFLEIHPNKYADGQTRINRLTHDQDYVFTTNEVTATSASRLLIGNKGDIDSHFYLQKHYENPVNGPKAEAKAKLKLEQATALMSIAEKEGLSTTFIKKLKEILSNPDTKDDEQMLSYKKMLIRKKLWK